MKLSSVLAGTALMAGSMVSAEVDPIVIKGSKFFYKSNGTEFFMRGVAYQEEYSGSGDSQNKYVDPLADPEKCKRDVPLLAELRTNTIRVYAINPESNHDECMKMLDDAGIYVVADLSQPGVSIIRDDPKWDDDLYIRYTSVIDELSQYTNTLGFFAGNEVTNNSTNTDASAYVKAAVRDMKAYIKQREYRPMGVGYATNDDTDIRDKLADYFACNAEEETIDFWGYNIYSWCGDSTFKESGYDVVVKDFKDYPAPVFFAEYGCNNVKPRKFGDVESMYGKDMQDVLSGGIVYMYFQEANDYGLVKVSGDKAKKLKDFENLKKQMNKVEPKGVDMAEYEGNSKLRKCPATGKSWHANKKLPPTPNKELCSCMHKSLSCIARKDLKAKEIGKLFGTVCGEDPKACAGISTDPQKGEFGAYSMCNPIEKLSHAMNTYYESNGQDSQACDFDGSAEEQEGEEPEGQCSSLIEQAGKDGSGTVTSVPTGSGGVGSEGGDESSAAFPLRLPAFSFGVLQLGAYVFCAMMAGAGVILL